MTTYTSLQAHNRKGFHPVAGANQTSPHVVHLTGKTGETIRAGDLVYLTSNEVALALSSTTELCGVAASGIDAAGEVAVYDDADQVFTARLDGSTVYSSGSTCDLTGGSGAMQLDANSSVVGQLVLLGPANPEEDHDAAGALWHVRIALHQLVEVSE